MAMSSTKTRCKLTTVKVRAVALAMNTKGVRDFILGCEKMVELSDKESKAKLEDWIVRALLSTFC